MSSDSPISRITRLPGDLGGALANRLSPERTRQPTLIERLTVRRLPWRLLVRVHRWLEFSGKIATGIYVGFLATVVLGVDWKHSVEAALNSGKPVRGAIALAIAIPTIVFLLARSMIGWMRWKIQRELWRRDVERLSAAPARGHGSTAPERADAPPA